jgi:hypothetical protein
MEEEDWGGNRDHSPPDVSVAPHIPRPSCFSAFFSRCSRVCIALSSKKQNGNSISRKSSLRLGLHFFFVCQVITRGGGAATSTERKETYPNSERRGPSWACEYSGVRMANESGWGGLGGSSPGAGGGTVRPGLVLCCVHPTVLIMMHGAQAVICLSSLSPDMHVLTFSHSRRPICISGSQSLSHHHQSSGSNKNRL